MSIFDPSFLDSANTNGTAPLHPQAIILPILAFPSWMLCIAPLAWQFRQGNIAAGSLILWVILANFFLSINPLIWPRDNLYDWWDGKIWCDLHVRIQVAAAAGTTASAAMIVRKLAKVMDTRNMTVSTSRNEKLREKVLEVVWCWGYPLVLIIVYYVIQPVRYIIYGIVGCLSAYDTSWPSIVLSFMWGPITTLVAAVYASILTYRLFRYRREFLRLISARNTTKSRFIRLFTICLIVIVVYVPYTCWLLAALFEQVVDTYSWSRVHDPERHGSILKAPAFGKVTLDRWGQVVTGYVMFFVFGTGCDAANTYKKMLLAVGLGRLFPSLCVMHQSGSGTPSSFVTARTWTSSVSGKAKAMFWTRSGSVTDTTFNDTTRNNSVVMGSMHQLRPTTTEEPMLQSQYNGTSTRSSLLDRIFRRNAPHAPVLPLFSRRSIAELSPTSTHKSATPSSSAGFIAHAWANDKVSPGQVHEADSVQVVRELHQDRQAVEEKISMNDWA